MKRIILTGLMLIIIFLLWGCAKTRGGKFAKKFVNELEFVDKNIDDDFFITEEHPNYKELNNTYPYLLTKRKFLKNFEKYNFLEAKIKKITINKKQMKITFLANPEIRGLPEFAKIFDKRKITIRAIYIKGKWKLNLMSIDTSGIEFFENLGLD